MAVMQIGALGLADGARAKSSTIRTSVLASCASRLPKLPSPWAMRSSSSRRVKRV